MDRDAPCRDSPESASENSSRRTAEDDSSGPVENLVLWIGNEESETIRLLRVDSRIQVVGPLLPSQLGQQLASVRDFSAAVIDVDIGDAAFDTVLQLNEAEYPCRSVIVGSDIDRTIVREAFFVGVQACLRKPVDVRLLIAEVLRASEATRVMRQCIEMVGSDVATQFDRRALDISVLTTREREILQMLLEGRTTRRMAENLDVSPRTVKFHVSNLLRKLGAGSRLSLMAKIHQSGLAG